jgi:hypothetical protein
MVGILNTLTKGYLSLYSRFQYLKYDLIFRDSLNPEKVILTRPEEQSRIQDYKNVLDQELAGLKEVKKLKDKTIS